MLKIDMLIVLFDPSLNSVILSLSTVNCSVLTGCSRHLMSLGSDHLSCARGIYLPCFRPMILMAVFDTTFANMVEDVTDKLVKEQLDFVYDV
jgi:hypothetical protein